MAKEGVSISVIRRLPRYYRFLGELLASGAMRISSRELSERMGLTASQIRQDLNCFGGFGQQGYGYNIADLHREIGNILGVNGHFPTVLIGAGNLGKAVATHMNFEKRGCNLIGIFDSNKHLSGKLAAGLEILPMEKLEEFCKEHRPAVAILCIPKAGAQVLAEQLVALGIKGFWNFSHYDLSMSHSGIMVENVHLGDSLLTLTYGVNQLLPQNESVNEE